MSLIQPVPSWIIETSRWEIQIKFIQHKDGTALIEVAHVFTQALTTLYDRYIKRVYHYCYQRTSNTHDAENLAA